ncbi:hypothetical protein [Companilactobacillus sp.]|nr:hypothetical protein [Companilactobacillus sp.]
MILILAFLFAGIWSLLATLIIRDKPKTCWESIALMSVLVYYLY